MCPFLYRYFPHTKDVTVDEFYAYVNQVSVYICILYMFSVYVCIILCSITTVDRYRYGSLLC